MKYCHIHLKVLEDLFTQLFLPDQCYQLTRQHLGVFFMFLFDSLSNQRAVKMFFPSAAFETAAGLCGFM